MRLLIEIFVTIKRIKSMIREEYPSNQFCPPSKKKNHRCCHIHPNIFLPCLILKIIHAYKNTSVHKKMLVINIRTILL